MPEDWGMDETTEGRERVQAEKNLQTAAVSAARSASIIVELRGLVSQSKALHQKNHYVPRLRRIFRGTA